MNSKKTTIQTPNDNHKKYQYKDDVIVFAPAEHDYSFIELEGQQYYEQLIAPNIEKIYDWFALEGLNETEVMGRLGIEQPLWTKYKRTCPKFQTFITKAKSIPKLQIKISMFQHATGYYVYETNEEFVVDEKGNLLQDMKKITRRKRWIPGSPTTQIFLAKALYPTQFQEQSVIGNMLEAPRIVDDIPDDED
jgi:hypothetical protein